MKIIAQFLLFIGFILGLSLNVWATPVTFDPDLSKSSITVTDTARLANITGNLVLDGSEFTLADGETQTLDFFTLTVSGLFAWNAKYNVSATLTFSTPEIVSEGAGGGCFSTIFGVLSGGVLTWNPESLPDYIPLTDGNKVKVDFESGCAFGFGNQLTVHAYVTNQGGAPSESTAAAVPEPLTITLLGAGLLGIGFCGHRRMKS